MPHFIIDCSEALLDQISSTKILTEIHDVAKSTGLFEKGDIKVRIRPYTEFGVGAGTADFVHIFGNIMEGRTTAQKVYALQTVSWEVGLFVS